jgi:hypothetical protein
LLGFGRSNRSGHVGLEAQGVSTPPQRPLPRKRVPKQIPVETGVLKLRPGLSRLLIKQYLRISYAGMRARATPTVQCTTPCAPPSFLATLLLGTRPAKKVRIYFFAAVSATLQCELRAPVESAKLQSATARFREAVRRGRRVGAARRSYFGATLTARPAG